MRGAFAVILGALTASSPLALAADPAKTLHVVLTSAEMSFDPQFSADAGSDGIIDHIYESMLDYDYLVRPVTLVPRTLEAMPTVSDGGATFVFRFKHGIYFTPDPAFKGNPRELTAADQAYALKRLLDPAVKSPWLWLVEGKIVGARRRARAGAQGGKFDYDAPIAGLEVVDRYTLRIRLKEPDLRFLYVFAIPNTAPSRAKSSRRTVSTSARIRSARARTCSASTSAARKSSCCEPRLSRDDLRAGRAGAAGVEGSRGRARREEAALRRPHPDHRDRGRSGDLARVPQPRARHSRDPPGQFHRRGARPRQPSTRARGQGHPARSIAAAEHALDVLQHGGSDGRRLCAGEDRAAARDRDGLRRRRVHPRDPEGPWRSGNGPSAARHRRLRPEAQDEAQLYDPAAARALLDRFGYKDRDHDGYRETPDGKPLVLERWSQPRSIDRLEDELWKKNMDAIGLRIVFRKDRIQDLRKMARQGKLPMRTDGWNADYPDGENFMQLLYGPNVGQENHARFSLPEFDRLYEAARRLPDSPERTALFDKMTEIVLAYAPWRLMEHRIEDHLTQPWVRNYKPHPVRSALWRYIDIDPAQRP